MANEATARSNSARQGQRGGMTYLGIDVGTSGVKALLIGSDQRIIASSTAFFETSRPMPGWAEQDPELWISACRTVLDKLRRGNRGELAATRGIGISGQMHGATLLDSNDVVLRPCILWNDSRAREEAIALDADPRFREITGNVMFPGFTAAKVEWVRRNEPEIFSKIARVLLPKDYIRWWLTGEYCSDMSDASGTGWLDVGSRKWSANLLNACQLDLTNMPKLVEGFAHGGNLRPQLAARWGMRPNVVVAGGGSDNAASAIGMGAVSDSDAFMSLGTSGVVFATTDSFRPRPESAVHAFCHALPDMWHQMGVILSATDSLNWYSRLSGAGVNDLVSGLEGQVPEPSGVLFLPYLSGERTPHNDTTIRGAFLGLDQSDDRETLTRAVLEGVGYALRDNLAALAAAGTQPKSLLAVGGGVRSRYWLETISTILDLPIEVPESGEFGAAFGAARLGMLAAENGDWRTICHRPAIGERIEPQSVHREGFEEAYYRFRAFYRSVKDI